MAFQPSLIYCLPLIPEICTILILRVALAFAFGNMAEVPVKLLNVCIVKPAIPTPINTPMFLSNVDLIFLPVTSMERLLFFPAPPPPHDFPSIVQTLQRSLSSALVHFYPLAGRLVVGEDSRPQIDCNDAGVEFIEASADLPFQDLENDDFQHRPIFRSLVHSLAHRNEDDDRPLFSIQVTAFGGGGLCIGFALHHVVADGESIWHFMKSWGECSRGVPISTYPYHDRTLLRSDKLNNNNNVVNYRICFKDGTLIFEGDGKGRPLDAPKKKLESDEKRCRGDEYTNLVCRTFHLSRKTIEGLKERASANGAAGPFSSFVSVAAHFWRCVVKSREALPDECVDICLFADKRNRTNPPLPPNFFGNCVQFACVRTTAGELFGRELSFAAGLIQNAVNSCTEKNFQAMVDWLEGREGVEDLGEARIIQVVGSPRFPLYEVDYGWGRTLQVQVASVDGIGQMLVYPGRDGAGSFDVSTGLPAHEMDIFRSLFNLDTI